MNNFFTDNVYNDVRGIIFKYLYQLQFSDRYNIVINQLNWFTDKLEFNGKETSQLYFRVDIDVLGQLANLFPSRFNYEEYFSDRFGNKGSIDIGQKKSENFTDIRVESIYGNSTLSEFLKPKLLLEALDLYTYDHDILVDPYYYCDEAEIYIRNLYGHHTSNDCIIYNKISDSIDRDYLNNLNKFEKFQKYIN